MRPKTRRPKLGQHFLTNSYYRSAIVSELDLHSDDFILEIGPGYGAMTELLIPHVQKVAAVELDAGLALELEQKFRDEPEVEIVNADILTVDLESICRSHQSSQCYVFGNLPYYITSPIIHHLLAFSSRIRAMALLVQREVADRLTAKPGTRDYGYLTVLARLYSLPRMALRVPPGAFLPPPKVESALVCFEMRPAGSQVLAAKKEEFANFLKQSFSYKRKMLLNCLSQFYPRPRIEQEIERLALSVTVRAEELSLEQFATLFSRLA